MERIDGTVQMPDGWEPKAGDVLRVTLEDVSRADAAATILAEYRHDLGRGGRQPFALSYDMSAVDPRARLAVRGQVRRQDAMVLTSTQHVPAPAHGTGARVGIELHEVASPQPFAQDDSLIVGSWAVLQIEDVPVEPGLRGSPLTMTFHGGAATGFAGCNSFRASCRIDGSRIELGTITATRRACVTGMDQEHRLLLALEGVTRFERSGPRLALVGLDDRVLVELTRHSEGRSG